MHQGKSCRKEKKRKNYACWHQAKLYRAAQALKLQVGFLGWSAGCCMMTRQLQQVVHASMQKNASCTCADADTIGGAWQLPIYAYFVCLTTDHIQTLVFCGNM